jgi:hypothetical protein
MEERSSRTRWVVALGLAVLAAFVSAIWLANPPAPPPERTDAAGPETSPSPPAAKPPETPEAGHRISEHGRLALETGDLPIDGPLVLALDLPDEARGSEPRPVVIASEDGRRLETMSAIAPGPGTGVHLEIDSIWLEPGRYMISVKTAEPSHFPLRRYVLEIR